MDVLMYRRAVLLFLHWGRPAIRKKTPFKKILKREEKKKKLRNAQ